VTTATKGTITATFGNSTKTVTLTVEPAA
jgi:hypothetical protein